MLARSAEHRTDSTVETARLAIATSGRVELDGRAGEGPGSTADGDGDWALVGHADPLPLEDLGDAGFRADHGLRLNYVVGAMANGIASEELVETASRRGLLAFFGAGGLAYGRVERAIATLRSRLLDRPWGANLIHSPAEPDLEDAVSRLYQERGVQRVSASAYLRLTLPIVRYRLSGLRRDGQGRVVCDHHVFAKVSRVEVARQFWAPAPRAMVDALRSDGSISSEQAELAAAVPVAREVTVEADSGGHTDNRPAIALLPTFAALRDRLQDEHRFERALRFGAAGGISTPGSVLAAFELGAAYVLTGSVNQGCLEAGTCDAVRRMLAEAEQADVAMAPAADMFEMGVKLQVLKRGTLFASRAQKLYDLYRAHDSLDLLPAGDREKIEKTVFRHPIDEVWRQTREFWQQRDAKQLQRAEDDPKHRMALVFRWYLGKSSHWANSGEPGRQADYQIWCGPAMGAFNEWARGSHLEDWRQRTVEEIALNLMHGAAVLARSNQLRRQGLSLAVRIRPERRARIEGESS
ncbi:MAG: PfaD family polyunsaturated fatty acid/polyketide biosynthesis protein [Acidobacteria bacterium]|nr:MAG: PfaD family polyunsaturated fatty acid/polyketide biosynthesis protein [Acidobacteriota bacterium]REK00312.1 MAG: PfaD family polyunsaturated fatty acid/polyketide biosynthesis protein [Acidobacteriota bacterium]